jgi:hypothetical protein
LDVLRNIADNHQGERNNYYQVLMKQDSTAFLKFIKYSGITITALMVAGIIALMILSRGKGEDITGIVAPALLVAIVSGVGATIAAVLQKRA